MAKTQFVQIFVNILISFCKRDHKKTANPCSLKWELIGSFGEGLVTKLKIAVLSDVKKF